MHSRFRAKSVTLTALAALLALLTVPGTLLAKPKPGVPGRGFRLQARAIGALTINRVYCGLAATGEICVDSTNSSTIGGGYWPKGSPQQYVFNSGLQAAGKVDTTGNWAWSGDTTGAFFFDPKGTTQHGSLIQPIWNYSDPNDQANWPQAAYVPQGDASELNFDPNLRGLPSASQGDIWTLAWDGNPSLIAGRPHPLGIAVETRGLGWNYPAGNEDIVYFIYTFYNITSANPASYAAIRPGMQEQMIALGQQFQALNNAAFGITIPANGYTIKDFYANFSADMDVSSDAGANYSSANLPFALGYVYEHTFRGPEGSYVLPPALAAAPFTNGYGFVGVKYLKSPEIDPDGPGGAAPFEVGINLFSNTVNGGLFNDPANTYALYRYVSGEINQGLGDGACNFVPATDKVCYIKSDSPADMRFFQSSGPFDLAPGEFGSIVVGYVFAGATASPGCATAGCGGGGAEVKPPTSTLFRQLSDASLLASAGASLLDSMTGFRGYNDANGNGVVEQNEFTTIRGSLLGKSLVAQTVFDSRFLLPSAPSAPEFFLVPGDNQVAIFWRPSATETGGDIFYSAASNPGTPSSPNLLYDPNYRQYDVEGYRIYRGRTNDPSTMSLLAQYDYGDEDSEGNSLAFSDYLGIVNPTPDCAPELGLETGCPVNFSNPLPGNAYTVSEEYGLASPFIQIKLGDRALLASGSATIMVADTTVTGGAYGAMPPLEDTGMPFVYVDKTAKNNLRYFYAVTAFDVNSIQSGPSSLESAKISKNAIPMHPGSNYDNVGIVDIGVFGRGVNMTTRLPKTPALDAINGTFSGPARPATGAEIGFVGDFVKQVVTQSGEMSVTIDSMEPGSPYEASIYRTRFFVSITTAMGVTKTSYDVLQDPTAASFHQTGVMDGGSIDGERAARFGGDTTYHLAGAYDFEYVGSYYTGVNGRGCVNSASGYTSGRCSYNGARWFGDSTETFPHPTRGNNTNGTAIAAVTVPTNAGSLPGVANVYEAKSYQTRPAGFRAVEALMGSASTAADYRLWWGANGTVDSVVDITHNVRVPFDTTMRHGYTWGFLTVQSTSAAGSSDTRPGVLSVSDLGCVNPIKLRATANAALGCAGGTTFQFVNSLPNLAAFGPLAYGANTGAAAGNDGAVTPTTNLGFGIYLAGHFFLIEMNSATPTAPAAGTLWTMRNYIGAISGGGGSVGTGGNLGAYSFVSRPSPFVAVGASVKAAYTVTNAVVPATEAGLDRVHTVPDPYYVTNGYETSPTNKVIKFVNLPTQSIVRIYSTSGVLVRVLENNSSTFGGSIDWDVRNRNNQIVASGVYFYAIEAVSGERRVGRMTIVNFAQ
jgi:hypothetical protein